jgi:hypothetical protein
VLEHVKIEPHQLQPREGAYELRVTEPREEAAYIDRLELWVLDHPAHTLVYPDERLAIGGPPPTHEWLFVSQPLWPIKAIAPDGSDCREALLRVDRQYAYPPALDRRFIGFCPPHSLELDFGDALGHRADGERLFLFIHGFIEYPYSQTVYAAGQAGVAWQPIRIEAADRAGQWQTVVPDAGAPGGMARLMTVDLTGCLPPATSRLRLTTNLEIGYDRIFLGKTRPVAAVASDLEAGSSTAEVTCYRAPLASATLRRIGFPKEVSPDGRWPLIYDYEQIEPTAPFHILSGAYTRYGAVGELLAEFDDRYVIMGPADEIVLRFAAAKIPPLAPGQTRSFVLVSHAYCKDMDLYTLEPQTLAPLPFRGMSRYPYPDTERFPESPLHREYQARYNTRKL